MAGLSLVAILITSVVTIFLITNLTLNSTEKAIKLNKQVSNLSSKINPSPASFSTDNKASFAIFTNGTLRDFSSSKYHNLSDEVFIDAQSPNIVNVKTRGKTWNDFFGTLPMTLSRECLITGTGQTFCSNDTETLKFYLNGQRNDNLLNLEIQNGDKVLITYGAENEEQIELQLNRVP